MRHLPLASSLLLLGACTVGPDYAGPPQAASAPLGDAFTRADADYGADAPALAQWWRSLGDPVLNELEDRALSANPDLAAAQARVEEARAALHETRANEAPDISAMGVAAHLRIPDVIGDSGQDGQGGDSGGSSSANFYNLGLNAQWEVDLFGGHRRQMEAGRAQLSAAEADLADAQVGLTSAVAQAYLNLRVRREQIVLAEQAVARRQQLLELEQQRFGQGVNRQEDVARAESGLALARRQLAPLQAEADAYRNALAILAGEAPGAVDGLLAADTALPLPPASIAVGDPAALIARRPDIRAAERKLAASNAQIGATRASGLPRLSFLGILGIGGTEPSDLTHLDDFTAIGAPMLQWKFLDFGRNAARVGQAEARRDAAQAQYRSTVLTALREVEDALSSFRQSRLAVAELARAEASAASIAQQTGERFNAGTASRREVLAAELERDAASQELAAGRAALTLDFVALQKALGLGWAGQPA